MRKIFLSIGVFGLLIVSIVSKAEWRRNGGWLWADPQDECQGSYCYNGDCLEMKCEHGCVENQTTGDGKCCFAGQLGDKCWGGLCCRKGLLCSSSTGEGTCVECVKDTDCSNDFVCSPDYSCGCPSNTTQYVKTDGTQGCCNVTENVLIAISDSTSVCCPKNSPIWDSGSKRCVKCLDDKDCIGESVCSPNKVCVCPDDKPVNRNGICITCPGNQVPNADKTDCICTNSLTEEICLSRGQHLYDETCECSGCLMCPKEKYNKDGSCETCPMGSQKTPDDFSKCRGKPKCQFNNNDAIGCCAVITASAYEHCQSGNGAFHGYKLGDNMLGAYDVEYVGGQWTCSRYGTWRPWCTTASSSCGCGTNLRVKTNGGFKNLYDHNSAIPFRGESYVYWADGPVWMACGVSGDGCTDNCGKLTLLFQKVL